MPYPTYSKPPVFNYCAKRRLTVIVCQKIINTWTLNTRSKGLCNVSVNKYKYDSY